MSEYWVLRQASSRGVRSAELSNAAAAFASSGFQAAEPSNNVDLGLLRASQAVSDPGPLLCLRCRVSHALEAWLRATHKAHGPRHCIELSALVGYALDDDGRLTIRTGPATEAPFSYAQIASMPKGLISPFSAEVLRTYDPALCGLPHWARLKIQSHNGLKAYFREHGLLLISDWALLRNSSLRRVREACQFHLRSSSSLERLMGLHQRYGPLYDQAKAKYKAQTGKASGWQPDVDFLKQLAPDAEPFTTKEELLAIAKAIRQMLTVNAAQSLDQAAEQGFEPVDPRSVASPETDGPTGGELRALIDAALQRAMDQTMPQVLAAGGKTAALLKCLWAGWAEGLTNRPLAERCGTTPGTVSKKMRPTDHATTIATAAAVELKRHPAFSSCGESVEAAERLVGALRNHLLEPEQEGDVAPLRRWVQQYLSQS